MIEEMDGIGWKLWIGWFLMFYFNILLLYFVLNPLYKRNILHEFSIPAPDEHSFPIS